MKVLSSKFYLSVFLFLNIINFVDRNILFAFGDTIKTEFSLSNTQWGLLTGLVFLFSYSVASVFIGVLGDRFSRTKIIGIGIIFWSAMTSLTGLAKNISTLFISRALIGVGESSLSPNAMSMLSDVFPQERRGLATAIYYLGIPLGVGFGFLIASVLGPILGWRTIFISLGVIGIVVGVLIYFMTEPARGSFDKKNSQSLEQQKISEIVKLAFKSITNSRSLWLIMLGGVIGHIPLGVGGFDTVWAVQERGFKEEEYTAIFGLFFVVGGSMGAIFGGLVGDYFAKRYKAGAMLALVIIYSFLIPASIYYRFASPDGIYFYIALFLITFQVTVFYGPTFAAVQSLSPYKVRTSILAIWILGVNIVGMGIGSFFTGYLSDTLFSNFEYPLSWSTSLMAAFTFFSLICYHLSRKTYDEDIKKAQLI